MAATAFIFLLSIQAVEFLVVVRFLLEGSDSHRCAPPRYGMTSSDQRRRRSGDGRCASPLPGSPRSRELAALPQPRRGTGKLPFSAPRRRAGEAGAGRGRPFPPPPEEVT